MDRLQHHRNSLVLKGGVFLSGRTLIGPMMLQYQNTRLPICGLNYTFRKKQTEKT